MGVVADFKQFAMKGNVIDLAVGVIIGGAFGKITDSLVKDVVMPPIGLLLGKVDFGNLFLNLTEKHYATLQEAKDAGAPTLNYGAFIQNVINFLILAVVVFLLVRSLARITKKEEIKKEEAPTTKDCPECTRSIPIKAKRCPECTAALPAAA